MWKKITAFALCASLCACLAACGKEEKESLTRKIATEAQITQAVSESVEAAVTTASTEPISTTAEPKKPYGTFNLNDVWEQNRVSVLLNNYGTISYVERSSKGEKTRDGCYFKHKDNTVLAEWRNNKYEGEGYSFSFDGNGISLEDGKYVMNVYAGPEEEKEWVFDSDKRIPLLLFGECDTVKNVKEAEDSYTFTVGFTEGEGDYIFCEVSKYDLSLRKIIKGTGENKTVSEFTYGGPVNDLGFTKGWDSHKTRTVTIIQELSVEGQIADGFMTIKAPFNVEVNPYSYGDYALYANGEHTKLFKYPGDDCDYTVYYTNIMG